MQPPGIMHPPPAMPGVMPPQNGIMNSFQSHQQQQRLPNPLNNAPSNFGSAFQAPQPQQYQQNHPSTGISQSQFQQQNHQQQYGPPQIPSFSQPQQAFSLQQQPQAPNFGQQQTAQQFQSTNFPPSLPPQVSNFQQQLSPLPPSQPSSGNGVQSLQQPSLPISQPPALHGAYGQPQMGLLLSDNMMQGPGIPSMPGMPSSAPLMNPAMSGMAPPPIPGGMPSQVPSVMGMGPPGMMPQQPKQRLDPNMMPSVVQVIEDDRSARSGFFPTGYPTAELPPLVSTEFISQDQGNSNPKFIRSTVYAVPQSSDMVKNSNLPISLSITPIAPLLPQEIIPPIIDLGDMGPIRCQRCKAYMSPFMEFIDGGRKFRCPFCSASTAVADNYFAHLDHTGKRTDIAYRPELYLGSYEFVATKEYCKNGLKPKEPAFIFFLDVTYNAVRNGLIELFTRNIVSLLKHLPKDYNMEKSAIKIGLATYDNAIHFYNLGKSSGRAEMLIVNDIEDIFVPLADGFLVDFEKAEPALVNCLQEIENNFVNTRITETMLGPVIQAGLDALKSVDRAGKLFVFHTSLPSLQQAPGALKNREDRKVLGTDKEKTMLTPATEFYVKLGEECVKYGCAVDLFFFPNSYLDLASVAPVANLSGGSIYKYQYFDRSSDGIQFLADLKRDISRDIIFDVMMRVRTSTGIRPTSFFGSFYMQNTTDIEVGAIDSDKSIQVEIKYDDKLDERAYAYFQTAILFTSCSGQRRLRVHNLTLSVSADFNSIYRLTDEDAMITHLFKHAERLVREKSPKDMREEMISICSHILAVYREKCSPDTQSGQLILPECLKLLPVHVNSIMKNDALIGGSEITVDERAWLMSLVPSMTVEQVSLYLYPRIYGIVDLATGNDAANGTGATIPPQIRASIDFFKPDEAYFIDNGLLGFIWIGSQVPQAWLSDVFDVTSLAHLETENRHGIPERDNATSRSLRHLLSKEGRPRCLKMFIVKQQDGLESWMKKFLVEDRYGNNSPSYVEFLCQIHREIRTILT